MRALVRKMAEDDTQALAERLAQLREDGTQPAAIGAQIIAIDDDADDAVGGIAAAHMIAPAIDRPQKPVGAARAHG